LKPLTAPIGGVGFVKISKKIITTISQSLRDYGAEKKRMKSSLDAKKKQGSLKKIKNLQSNRRLNYMISLHCSETPQISLDSAHGTHSPSLNHFMKDTNY
jgi:hypothetical protein